MAQQQETSTDRLASWKNRWDGNRIGWHDEDVNESLRKYGSIIIPGLDSDDTCADTTHPPPVRVFVPLCGKSVDMAYLAASPAVSQVVGVDGIQKALTEFASEQPQLNIIQPTAADDESEMENNNYERLVGDKIELLRGDFFELDSIITSGTFDAIYDRASMVAIEPSLREKYVEIMKQLLSPGGQIFLVTIERRSGDMEADRTAGPPFSIPEGEVRRLYEQLDWVESVTLLDDNGEQERNAGSTFVSLYFRIQRKK